MPEKRQDKRSPNAQANPPKQPPKEPPQDYTSLPQKPIKLKPDVTLPPALKRNSKKSRSTADSKLPSVKKKARKKAAVKSPQITDRLSQAAREVVISAAEREGLEPDAWLDRCILEFASQSPAADPAQLHEILQALNEIRQRLDRIENQRGFWRRFWDQYMDPKRR